MDGMNTYQKEQLQALRQVQRGLERMEGAMRDGLNGLIQPYLDFRKELQQFLTMHLGQYCTQACFSSQSSACCSKDGIITFWADHVVNACCCDQGAFRQLASAAQNPQFSGKCIYLAADGCLWKVTPLVCAMFVCDQAHTDIFHQHRDLDRIWERYRRRAKAFRWPDRPVLFDQLEEMFMDLGCQSPLMYINSSPGLRQVKIKAGLMKGKQRHKRRPPI
jgi:hypothetical protein